MVQIKMSLGDNGDHPAPVILVFRNRPILAHNNKKYDYSGVARVCSHCMAPIPACAGMNPSEAQDTARTQSAGDTYENVRDGVARGELGPRRCGQRGTQSATV